MIHSDRQFIVIAAKLHPYISCYFPPSTNLLIWSFPPWNNKSRTHHTHEPCIIHLYIYITDCGRWSTYLVQLAVIFNGEIRKFVQVEAGMKFELTKTPWFHGKYKNSSRIVMQDIYFLAGLCVAFWVWATDEVHQVISWTGIRARKIYTFGKIYRISEPNLIHTFGSTTAPNIFGFW